MLAPTGHESFSYDPVDLPVSSSDPSQARPIGVGPVANGGDTLNVTVNAGFSAPVNVAISVYAAPVDDEEVFFMNEHGSLTPLSAAAVLRDRERSSDSYRDGDDDDEHDGYHDGDDDNAASFEPIVLWKRHVTSISENVYGPVPISELPSGIYIVTLTVKSGHDSYRWTTHFRIP